MRKTPILVLLLSLTFSFVLLSIPLFTAESNYLAVKPTFTHSFTKAFCNESGFCEDYEIFCNNEEISKIVATGFAVQFSEDWEDIRTNEQIESFC